MRSRMDHADRHPAGDAPRTRSIERGHRRRAGWLALLVGMVALAAPGSASLGAASPDGPGPFEVTTMEVTVPRTRGGEDTFQARVFVPVVPEGSAAAPAPVVAFGHGYQTGVDAYESTLAHLASWGIVVIAPRSGGELFPSHAAFAADLLSALDWVVTTAGSPDGDWPGGPVDPGSLGLSGHSMGGGAALLAAAGGAGRRGAPRDGAIRTVATLAAAETDPSAISAAAGIGASTLFVAASDDTVTPVGAHQRPMFEAAAGAAQLRTIPGAGHCGFLDQETPILLLVCGEVAIGAEEQRRITRGVLTAWLRTELTADRAFVDLAWPVGPVDGAIVESRGPR
jgi:dienelactone hydrolase